MGKVADGANNVRTFVGEVKGELKKSSWPPRSELVESAIVIIVSVLILGLFVGFCDLVIKAVLDFIL